MSADDPIPPAQKEKLSLYLDLLKKWQKTINLVSANTLEQAWQRHVLDSTQLSSFIEKQANLIDFGSGAGFPGLALSILRPDLHVTLIESDSRKCAFLSTVSRETESPVTILNKRIEEHTPEQPYDLITARALAPLPLLLQYARPYIELNPELICLFLKGTRASQEIQDAETDHHFSVEVFPSQTAPDSSILRLSF